MRILILFFQFQLKPGKAEETDELEQKELEDKFKVAYIVFAKEQSIANLKTASENGDKMIVSTIENPVITGLESFCARYNQSFPNIKKLQVRFISEKSKLQPSYFRMI